MKEFILKLLFGAPTFEVRTHNRYRGDYGPSWCVQYRSRSGGRWRDVDHPVLQPSRDPHVVVERAKKCVEYGSAEALEAACVAARSALRELHTPTFHYKRP